MVAISRRIPYTLGLKPAAAEEQVPLYQVLIVSAKGEEMAPLVNALPEEGFEASLVPPSAEALTESLAQGPEAVLFDLAGLGEGLDIAKVMLEEQARGRVAFLALVTPEQLPSLDPTLGLDDFALRSATPQEVAARIRQVLWRKARLDARHLLRRGDLVIDTAGYKVFVNGRPVQLTYKEYELLRFLAANPGRVFTREELLNKVWGYEFYGGTRTVDVHIRRLRAKLESSHQTFIETVRNVGYRFRPGGG